MTIPKFVLVDDNKIDLMVNERLLKNAFGNVSVTTFNNPADALAYFNLNKDHPEILPSVLLLDIIMPGLDGFNVVNELTKIFIEIPFKIFLLSSTLDSADFTRAGNTKFVVSILGKPLETDLLRQLI